MPATPEQRYQKDLSEHGFKPDPAQAKAIEHLQAVFEQLILPEKRSLNPLKWIKGNAVTPVKGLYLWGGVGRGKTWLMDTFYDCLPFKNKRRMHFHHFMKYTHDELRHLAGRKNPLKEVARRLAGQARVICFDEFFVTDIADAMILGGLLEHLFNQGVTLVTTSNIEPDGLYQDGLQRARFLPAIALLNKNTVVLNVDSGTDYRLRILEQAETYYFPLGQSASKRLQNTFDNLVPDPAHRVNDRPLLIAGRHIPCKHQGNGIGWFTFLALCDGPRSQNDYIEIACLFHTVLLEGLPVLSSATDDQARRFISLVDEFYDRHVTLIISADTPIHGIYTGSKLAFAFERTISRLQEMQSTAFLSREHIGG
ncbi:cell division protein ZapE [Candidatus Sororendozoicomonas aggregata]|uniref:cell division protein ZapE n=1 Tax=Candidatus Sororendozoicomonas aggregata TaxID=3073239 RepID=UPI002ED2E551